MSIFSKLISLILSVRNSNEGNSKVAYELNLIDDSDKNIIFLSPVCDYPSGGNIVVHNQCETICSFQYKNYKSSVLYPDRLNYKTTWFVTDAKYKRDLYLNNKTDFIIVPEIYAAKHANLLINLNVQYAINVQNGYLMDFESKFYGYEFNKIKRAYQNATFIIGNSDDTVENIKLTFPDCAAKVMKSHFVIDKAGFKPLKTKKNLITYMPRKLTRHTELLLFMVKESLPLGWCLEAIDNVSEAMVYEKLSDTKIFLSFSEFEGLAMPPVMAALSGAHVIGYTGEGSKEYFHFSCFTEVSCGDIKHMIYELLKCIKEMDAGKYSVEESALIELKNMFSKETQDQYLRNLVTKIEGVFESQSCATKLDS